MYVCICNALTDKDFTRAAEQGATNVREAFKALGEKPECGRCFSCAREVLTDARMDQAQRAMPLAAE